MEKKYYTINTKKKTITIDTSMTPTKNDELIVLAKQNEGYILKIKSQKKSKQAKKRAEANKLTKNEILKALENDGTKLAKFKEINSNDGFFKAKAWYLKDKNESKKEDKKEDKKETTK